MKNNKPQNLFFTCEINYIKLFILTITLLISKTTLAEIPSSVFQNSTNFNGLFVTTDLFSGSCFNASVDYSMKFHKKNNSAELVLKRVDFEAGFLPIAFNVAVNSYGDSNTGNFALDRKSINDEVAITLQQPQFTFLSFVDANYFC